MGHEVRADKKSSFAWGRYETEKKTCREFSCRIIVGQSGLIRNGSGIFYAAVADVHLHAGIADLEKMT